MNISSFSDLLAAARAQSEPQRLLFVFAQAELAEDSTDEERRRFEAGEGGALVPVMTVDKAPDEIVDFATLARESLAIGNKPWAIVFVAAIGGRQGVAPAAADVAQALDGMTASIRSGNLSSFIPFDRDGHTVVFN